MNPKVNIIILNFNGWEDTIECLESIYKITYPNWEVIVIDNGSDDDSVSKIKEWATGKIIVKSRFFKNEYSEKPIHYVREFFYAAEEGKVEVNGKETDWDSILPQQKLSIFRLRKNYGFAGGNNIGIEYILKYKKTEYILLLNNDTIVDPKFLDELINAASDDEKIAFAGPKIYRYNSNGRNDVICFAGGKLNIWKGQASHVGENEIDKGQYDNVKEVDFIEGSCILARIEIVNRIGLLNTDYFLYWEDVDWCVRARSAGYKNLYVPRAKIWHKGAATSTKISGIYEYYMTRNRFRFIKQHATKKQYLSFLIYFFGFRFWVKEGIHLLYHKNLGAFMQFVKGTLDGTLHREGRI